MKLIKYLLAAIAIFYLLFAFSLIIVFGAPLEQEEVYQMCVDATEEIADGSLSPDMIMAMIEKESCLYPDVTAGSCVGLMQINEKCHKSRMKKLGVTDLRDPYSNILVGTDYVWELFQDTEDPYLVLMRYNMGSDKANKLYNQGIYTKYATKIMDRSAEIERERGK